MLIIIYTNGDKQLVNVDHSFYTVSVVEKNGKQLMVMPIEKAETLALDLTQDRRCALHKIELYFPEHDVPKTRHYDPLPIKEDYYPMAQSVKDEKRRLRNMYKNQPLKLWARWTF